jgi:hypothetical protein
MRRCSTATCPAPYRRDWRLPTRPHGKGLGQAGIAAQNVLDLHKAYAAGEGNWDPDNQHADTVGGGLARLRDGGIVPYAGDADPLLAWTQSEVSVAQYRIAACPVPSGLEGVAEAAKASGTRPLSCWPCCDPTGMGIRWTRGRNPGRSSSPGTTLAPACPGPKSA